MHLWRKIVEAEQIDAWAEQLLIVVDPQRLAIVALPNRRTQRLEVYCDTARQARHLVTRFGGQVREIKPASWQPAPATAPGRPLSVGGKLLVTSRETELVPLRAAHPGRSVLCLPAAMAFGTGEHATTAMCLRLVLAVTRHRPAGSWNLLDLGTGSGILALAGKQFGARSVLGLDNDPHAVRTARENARLNDLATRTVRFTQADLPAWTPPAGQTWAVVTANLFSELLIRLMRPVIAPAVAPGGDLILSGVLATQADEVVAAVRAAGLTLVTVKSRGRWRAFHCTRPGARPDGVGLTAHPIGRRAKALLNRDPL